MIHSDLQTISTTHAVVVLKDPLPRWAEPWMIPPYLWLGVLCLWIDLIRRRDGLSVAAVGKLELL